MSDCYLYGRNRLALLVPARTLSYDTLVIAVGSTTNDFGTPGAAEHCLFLDTAQEAVRFTFGCSVTT